MKFDERPASLVCGGPSSHGSSGASCARDRRAHACAASSCAASPRRSRRARAARPTGAAHAARPRSAAAAHRPAAAPGQSRMRSSSAPGSSPSISARHCGDDPRGDRCLVGAAIGDLVGERVAQPRPRRSCRYRPVRTSARARPSCVALSPSCPFGAAHPKSRAPCPRPLTFAVPKGRILDEALPLMARAGVVPEAAFHDKSIARADLRLRRRATCAIIRVRAFDVATFVAHGAAQAGIVGSDVIEEFDYSDLYAPVDLDIGHCRLSVAEPAVREPQRSTAARATCASPPSTPASTRRHFERQGIQAECVKLNGAMELAPGARPCRAGSSIWSRRAHAEGQRPGRNQRDHAGLGAADRQPRRAQDRPRASPRWSSASARWSRRRRPA